MPATGRLANGISTAGPGIAIFAIAGLVAGAAVISTIAAWQLVRNGCGAPAGLLVAFLPPMILRRRAAHTG